MNTRMDRSRLNIGVYHLRPYARTEKHIKEVADCGIDFVIDMSYDIPVLDLFHKYGVGAILSGIVPGWWGGDGQNAGKLATTNTMDQYMEAAAAFVDHPAVWGIDIGDEPSALDFPYYGKVFDYVNTHFPKQFPYLNLYPNYASVSQNTAEETLNQLGTATYAQHIRRYCECVPSDYICYDFYCFDPNLRPVGITKHYDNLRVVANEARNTGRSMWIVLQVNSSRPELWMSENNLRFQVYTAMAFGAENITWACYTAGWWYNQVLDEHGEKTQQYEKLKHINAEIRTLADTYMKYRRVDTHFVDMRGNEHMACVSQDAIDALSTGVFLDVKAHNNAPLIIGEMVSRNHDGSTALMICAADDPYDQNPQTYHITFACPNRQVSALGGEGYLPVISMGDGVYGVEVKSNQGILITAR